MVGRIDGAAGTNTSAALAAFQRHEGLPVTGVYDAATREALQTAEPVDRVPERTRATAHDLAAEGSKTIKAADKGSLLAWGKGLIGTALAGGGIADKAGLLDTAQAGIDKANQAKGIWDSFCDLAHPLFAGPAPIIVGVVLIGAAIGVAFLFARIRGYRVADHVSGVHAGPQAE
jgi:hypothetical protein